MRRLPHVTICSIVVTLLGALLSATAPPAARSAGLVGPETRALWVVRDSLASPASIASVVEEAVAGGFNALIVQVRGRGDAYYLSALEPRSHLLATQPSFDPLATVLAQAHAVGIEVHAWVNVNLVASVNLLPAARDHVVNRHPEWLMVPRVLAQELAGLSPKGPGYIGKLARWTRAHQEDVEGLYVSPLVPAAASHTVAVLEDLVRRYPVDGIHLDYVRYPGPDFDHSRQALDAFAAAMAGTLPPAERRVLAAQAREDVLAWVDAYPQAWADFRRSRLTALVMRLQSVLRATRPKLVVSAAVVPDQRIAFVSRLQDWRLWAETGLLDVLCPMAYTNELETFRQQIDEAVRATAPALVWAGIGAYRLSPGQTVAHIESARAAGARGIVLFSYDTIASRSPKGYLDTIRRAAFGGEPAGPASAR
jgi:uncharacterized lipoprotein YddW (UPF0748 family)